MFQQLETCRLIKQPKQVIFAGVEPQACSSSWSVRRRPLRSSLPGRRYATWRALRAAWYSRIKRARRLLLLVVGRIKQGAANEANCERVAMAFDGGKEKNARRLVAESRARRVSFEFFGIATSRKTTGSVGNEPAGESRKAGTGYRVSKRKKMEEQK